MSKYHQTAQVSQERDSHANVQRQRGSEEPSNAQAHDVHPLEKITSGIGDAACVTKHVSVIQRTGLFHPMNQSQKTQQLLRLQQRYGNRFVQRVIARHVIQTPLQVSQPGDIYEQEADWVADRVMGMPTPQVQRQPEEEEEEPIQPKPLVEQITPLVQRQAEEEKRSISMLQRQKEEEKELQAKEMPGQTPEVTPNLEARINAMRDGGRPLSALELTVNQPGNSYQRCRPISSVSAGMLQRQGSGRSVARPSLSGLRTIAQGYIGDYFSAARAGLNDFENDMQSSFDWSAFGAQVLGNVIWALSAFATGGTAFIISLVGITVSTVAAASVIKDRPDFHQEAVKRINDVTAHLNNEVDRVTREVDAEAASNNWDDKRTRGELLSRLLKPYYVTLASGGLPNIDQPAVAASVRENLLIKASRLPGGSFFVGYGPGYFKESWKVGTLGYTPPWDPWYSRPRLISEVLRSLRLIKATIERGAIPDINDKINDVYSGREIDPSVWKIPKYLQITDERYFNLEYYFDSDNKLTRLFIPVELETFFTVDHGINPELYFRNLMAEMQKRKGTPIPRVPRLG